MKFTNLRVPDITLAQILSGIAWIVGQGVAMGAIDSNTSKFILSLATTIVSAAWVIADSVIRHGRATGPVAAAIASPGDTIEELKAVGFKVPEKTTPAAAPTKIT